MSFSKGDWVVADGKLGEIISECSHMGKCYVRYPDGKRSTGSDRIVSQGSAEYFVISMQTSTASPDQSSLGCEGWPTMSQGARWGSGGNRSLNLCIFALGFSSPT